MGVWGPLGGGEGEGGKLKDATKSHSLVAPRGGWRTSGREWRGIAGTPEEHGYRGVLPGHRYGVPVAIPPVAIPVAIPPVAIPGSNSR